MSQIFISHVEEDAAITVEIAVALEAEGYSTWYYQRDTIPGTPYLIQVGKAIEACGAFLVIISPMSV